MALTQPQLLTAVAERAELSKADAKRVVDALEAVVLDELANAQKVRIGGLVQLIVRVNGAEEAPRPQSRDRRGDHHRRQARQRRCPRPPPDASQAGAAVGAESPPPARRLTQPLDLPVD